MFRVPGVISMKGKFGKKVPLARVVVAGRGNPASGSEVKAFSQTVPPVSRSYSDYFPKPLQALVGPRTPIGLLYTRPT